MINSQPTLSIFREAPQKVIRRFVAIILTRIVEWVKNYFTVRGLTVILFMDHFYSASWKSKMFSVFIQLISVRDPQVEYGLY